MNTAIEKVQPKSIAIESVLAIEIERIRALEGLDPKNSTFSDILKDLRQKQNNYGKVPLKQLEMVDHATLLALTAGIKTLANPVLGNWDEIMDKANHLVNGHLPNLVISGNTIKEAANYLVELDQRGMNINAKDWRQRFDAKKAMEEAKNLSVLTGMFKLNERQRPKATQESKTQMKVISNVISKFGIQEPFF